MPWTVPALPLTTLAVDSTAGHSARAVGLWWSYCCQILETIDEPDRFVYGTVRGHAERTRHRRRCWG